MQTWIDRLQTEHRLESEQYRLLLTTSDADTVEYLHRMARFTATEKFGTKIFIRGLIEVSNYCRNNCLYCGIRKGNRNLERYRLDKPTILACCRHGYQLGFRTFVLQGGEDPRQPVTWWVEVVRDIRTEFPDCAITLSLGEMEYNDYKSLYLAGANRYLLRHETHNEHHYTQLHPQDMSLKHRLQCLDWLFVNKPMLRASFLVQCLGRKTHFNLCSIPYSPTRKKRKLKIIRVMGPRGHCRPPLGHGYFTTVAVP